MKVSLTISLILCCCGMLRAQFTDIAPAMDFVNIHEDTEYGNGLSFYDFNHDGWDDVTIANGDDLPRFLVNQNGILTETEIALPIDPQHHIVMILWADIENDGDSDLLTTELEGSMHLMINDGSFGFTDVTAEAGLITGDWRFRGAAFADYDHDGFLDLYVARYYAILNADEPDFSSRLFRNNGDGTFADVTDEAGVHLITSPVFQPVFTDYNNDGWEDLYIVIDRSFWENKMFRNNQDGTFTDVSDATGADPMIDAMSGTFGDYDNDGDLDIYVTNGWPGNRLYENNGDETFTEISLSAGVRVNMICWGASWLDYDNDSWQDLYVGTTGNFFGYAQSHFFINQQDDTFRNGDTITGILGDSAAVMIVARGDINNDGYYDFVTNSNDPWPSSIWMNDGGQNNYLSVSLQGIFANRDGIGSWIHCYAGGNHYVRHTMCGSDLNAQSSGKSIFGLDSLATIDSLVVEWNSGTTDVFYALQANQDLHLVEGISHAQPFYPEVTGNLHLCPGDSVVLDGGDFNAYLWNTGDTSRTIVITAPGTFHVEVTDVFGHVFNSNETVITMSLEPADEILVEHVQCYGTGNGSVLVMNDEQLIADVIWSDDYIGFERTQLSPGILYYTLLDTMGCTFEDSLEIIEPDLLQLDVEVYHLSCAGENNGQAIPHVTGGIPPYDIDWNGMMPDNLAPGEYLVQVTDSAGCQVSVNFSIEGPALIEIDLLVSDVSCSGYADGNVVIDVAGGTPPYTVDWNGASPGSLSAGDYFVLVTDSLGCQMSDSFFVSGPAPISAEAITGDVSCFGYSDGSALILANGGTPPYHIDWNGLTPDSLYAGYYQVLLTDTSGCALTVGFQVGEPGELICEVIISDGTGTMPMGAAEVLITGGTSPYAVYWDNGESGVTAIDSLQQGQYLVQVLDAAGCHCSSDFYVGLIDGVSAADMKSSLFPVPCRGYFVLNYPRLNSLFLADTHGRILKRWESLPPDGIYEVSEIPDGIYLLNMATDGGINTRLMIIEHR